MFFCPVGAFVFEVSCEANRLLLDDMTCMAELALLDQFTDVAGVGEVQ